MEKRQITKIFLALSIIWTILISFFIGYIIYQKYNEIKSLALLEARTGINKDLAFRTWVASKGGVYAPIDKNSPPNPYLKVPNRDVNTTTGVQLTLLNPAYALRQVTESYGKYSGVKGHLTSLKLINPHNQPDQWEDNALHRIETSRKDLYEITDGTLRYMRPFFIDQKCLKCHGNQGYRVGDIRGGLSVQIPLSYYDEIFTSGIQVSVTIIITMWCIGLIGLYWGYRSSFERINEKINLYEQNLYSLVALIEQRDNYTAGHGKRVGEYSRLIGKHLGLDEIHQEELYRAGALHDIGKVAIPDSILLKPGKLEPIERKLIEEHVNASYELLSKVEIFTSIAEIIRYHHERFDGSGYPFGLSGDAIPFNSQILAIADCFDAMTTNRIYKGRKGVHEALNELQTSCKSQFHPDIITAAFNAFS
ncbi:HD domain-containing phosphohydrolase, partial [Sulfuricurvum sp.]|uniref:HD domain-containing phosphohydrolase n=1 Tax=Sulfuricurvum sp. TaxID=2025608 RepID=UPI003BB7318D